MFLLIKFSEFEADLLSSWSSSTANVLETLKSGVIDDTVTEILEKVAADIAAKFEQD